MDKIPLRLLVGALALGWLFDLLFWGRPVGANYLVFLLALPAAAYLVLRPAGFLPARTSLLLLIPVVFFSALAFIRTEPLTLFLAYSISILTLLHYFITYGGGRWLQYGVFDLVDRYLRLLFAVVFAPLDFLGKFYSRSRAERRPTRIPFIPLLRGVLISIPIIVILGSLLVSADVVFHQQVYEFGLLFNIENIGETILRLFVITFVGYTIIGLYLNTEINNRDATLHGESEPVVKPVLGFIETATVLGSVIALFTLFVLVQFRYFFGGEANIGVEGYTFSEYARRGFNEILIVASVSLVLIVGLSNLSRREANGQRRAIAALVTILGALVFVMLVSAYYRLELGIQWHGFSRLRFYPRIFLFWLGLLIVAVVVLEWIRRQRFFTTAALFAALGFAFSIGLLNVDASIVHYNVFRARQGRNFNVTHLAMLSIDAVPALAEEFRNPDLASVSIREGIGAALACHLQRTEGDPPGDWRSFNLARQRLESVRTELEPALQGYRINSDRIDPVVVTPSGTRYQCIADFGDY